MISRHLTPIWPQNQNTEVKPRAGDEEFKKIKEKITTFLEAKGAEEKVKLTLDSRGLVISLKDSEFFDSGSASVRQWSRPLLNDIASAINNYNNAIRIEGHTDNVPIKTPAYPSNWELSTARATNIVQYLITSPFLPTRETVGHRLRRISPDRRQFHR